MFDSLYIHIGVFDFLYIHIGVFDFLYIHIGVLGTESDFLYIYIYIMIITLCVCVGGHVYIRIYIIHTRSVGSVAASHVRCPYADVC